MWQGVHVDDRKNIMRLAIDCQGVVARLLVSAAGVISKCEAYTGTSLIRNSATLGPCSRIMPRALWWLHWGALLPMSKAPL
jgi:hypothetical protein